MTSIALIIAFLVGTGGQQITVATHSIITGFDHSPVQRAYELSRKRFNVVPAGRRSGKTAIAKRRLVKAALSETQYPDASFFAAAPTREQAKRIFWNDLKRMVNPKLIVGEPRETELVIPLYNGAEICVIGLDKPERIEGSPRNGGIVDEFGNIKDDAWEEHIRPALTDRLGWCDFIGVPEGRNHYHNLYKRAQLPENREDWDTFTWTTEDILHLYLGAEAAAKEIAAAKRDLDPLTYGQEYGASFVNFEGRAYYQFKPEVHAAKSLKYHPEFDLIFCFDFNKSPGVAVVCQEIGKQTHVIGEVFIPRNSTTPAVCRKLIADWGGHKGHVLCYGDATGGAGGSAKVEGSDWDLVEAELTPIFKDRLYLEVPDGNPRERSRVNAVNSRLESVDGTVSMLVDPEKARWTANDLDSVVTRKGGSGEIDKDGKRNKLLTHLSDALGYFITKEFPVGGGHITIVRHLS